MKEGSKKEKKGDLEGDGEEKDSEAKDVEAILDSLEPEKKVPKKSYLRILIFLIALILIVDSVSIYFYVKTDGFSDFSGFSFNKASGDSDKNSGNKVLKCEDGTDYGECSKNKPFYCYGGELLNKAYTCGCPEGYKRDFQSCKEI